MTGLIKSGAGVAVRSPFAAPQVPAAAVSPLISNVDQKEVEALRARVAQLEKDAAAAVAAARRAGIEEGVRRAAGQRDARETQLGHALTQARSSWDGRLAELEPLALLLASKALEKVFGRGVSGRDAVLAAINTQVQRLSRDSVVGVRVSGADFDQADLAQLERLPGASPTIDTALGKGEAVIDLQLGQIEVSPATQWTRLRAFFEERVPLDLAA